MGRNSPCRWRGYGRSSVCSLAFKTSKAKHCQDTILISRLLKILLFAISPKNYSSKKLLLYRRGFAVLPDDVAVEHLGHDLFELDSLSRVPLGEPLVEVEPDGLDVDDEPFDEHDANVAANEHRIPS